MINCLFNAFFINYPSFFYRLIGVSLLHYLTDLSEIDLIWVIGHNNLPGIQIIDEKMYIV